MTKSFLGSRRFFLTQPLYAPPPVEDNKRFEGLVELDPSGYITAGEDCLTGTPGVFAAGDTRTKKLRQLVTAAADGAMAANQAAAYIRSLR